MMCSLALKVMLVYSSALGSKQVSQTANDRSGLRADKRIVKIVPYTYTLYGGGGLNANTKC